MIEPSNRHLMVAMVLVCVVAYMPPVVAADTGNIQCILGNQTDKVCCKSQVCLELQKLLKDEKQVLLLLQDPSRICLILKQNELRREILRHPLFVRRMLLNADLRKELLQNEMVMREMLHDKSANRELNLNLEIMKEIEKNDAYRQQNMELQALILEEQLLE